jgi:hypothetical protein
MGLRRFVVSVTTASDGTATAYSPPISGLLHSVSYVKPGSGSYDDGVDFTITKETTGEGIWTESNVNATAHRSPRAPQHSQAGVAALYAAGGTAVQEKIALARERIKIVIAQGGNAKTGAFHFNVEV